MTVHVFHLSDRATCDERYDAMAGFSEDHAVRCSEMWKRGLYEKVAEVEGDDLEHAFERTNTIDRYWWEHGDVTSCFDGPARRSTSVGDILTAENGDVHVVSSFGFTKLEVPAHHPARRLEAVELSPEEREKARRIEEEQGY